MRLISALLAACLSTLSLAAHADVTMRVTETSEGVEVDVTGNIDLAGLTPFTLDREAQFTAITGVNRFGSSAIAAGVTPDQVDRYLLSHVDVEFVECACQRLTNTFSGAFFILSVDTGNARTTISLPTDYISGSPFNTTATYATATFDELGLLPGTYEFDQVTLIIGEAAPPVDPPQPIEIAIDERIRVIDDNTQVLAALVIVVEETIKVLDAPSPLPALTLLVEETIRVLDEPEVQTQANGPIPPNPDLITLDIPNPPLFPGDPFTALAGGFKPFSQVQAFLESTPVLIGQATADANGNVFFQLTVPPDFPPGWHTLALVGVAPDDSPRRLTAAILIVGPASDVTSYAIPGPSRNNPGLWILLGIMLLTGGLRLYRGRENGA